MTPVSPEIADYSLIGNCRTAALVSRYGSIDWCCFPEFDSPSYFARLLGERGGHFCLSPIGEFRSEQRYISDTNVLETRFEAPSGTVILTDLFSVRDADRYPDQLWPDQEILRFLKAERGELEFELSFLPNADYGRRPVSLRWIGDWGLQCRHGAKLLLLQTSLPATTIRLEEENGGPSIKARFLVRQGSELVFSLSYSQEGPAVIPPLETAGERRRLTLEYWSGWSRRSRYRGTYRALVDRSALALKLLNFSPSGAFVAAPTMSLPENLGGSRNWDYRFCWLRDASFTTRALMSLGYHEEARAFLNWLLHSTRLSWPRLQVLYSVYGESRIGERDAGWLPGFGQSKPVRIGNLASQQMQLDVYGEVIDSFFCLSEFLAPIDQETQKMVTGFGQAVAELWAQPDQGIWEFRSGARHYTHSKVLCWVAMDRLDKLSRRFRWKLPYCPEKIAADIRAEIEQKGFNSRTGTYVRAFGETELDASLLVMPLVGYCGAADERFRSTRDAIAQGLSKNGLIYRYSPGSDGLPEPEGAFTICNFWMCEALARAGEIDQARKWFWDAVARFSDSGLASEEIDPDRGALLGNHPQGFSHIGLINAALALDESEGRLAA